MDLAVYGRARFALAEVLQTIIAHKLVGENPALEERLQALLVRLAEDRFNLVVAGRFSRGKSSLMNAILGQDRLPTGIVPLTSVITTVSYGSTEKVTLRYRQRRLDSEITLAQLPDYVTEIGNPGNCRGIASAHIELNADILRRGFYFIDTPGWGSAIAENAATTQAFLPEADALLLVSSVDSPLSEDEKAVYSQAAQGGRPIFVVLNKQDLVTADERRHAVDFVGAQLAALGTATPVGIFCVSARDGLKAKLAGNDQDLAASGLAAFEAALIGFLLQQKQAVFLAQMCQRIEALVLALPESATSADLRVRVRILADQYGASQPVVSANTRQSDARFSAAQLQTCEICVAIDARLWDFLSRFQYQLATEQECQTGFAAHSGFCAYHTAEYQKLASPFGTCSGYPPLLEGLAKALRQIDCDDPAEAQAAMRALLPDHDACPMCAVQAEAQTAAIASVATRLNARVEALNSLTALCQIHLTALIGAISDPALVRAMLDRQAQSLVRVAEDMRSFTLKQSAVRRKLFSKEEQSAAVRGLDLLTGHVSANFAAGQDRAQASASVDHAQDGSK